MQTLIKDHGSYGYACYTLSGRQLLLLLLLLLHCVFSCHLWRIEWHSSLPFQHTQDCGHARIHCLTLRVTAATVCGHIEGGCKLRFCTDRMALKEVMQMQSFD